MNNDDIHNSAEMIWDHWSRGKQMISLPESIQPRTRAEGYQIQASLERKSQSRPFGWKIAATSLAGQKHIGVSGPLAGRLFEETVYESGAKLLFGENKMGVAEPEFAFRLMDDLFPRRDYYTPTEILEVVGSLHPAIEIPNSRFLDFTSAGEAQLIADNACAHQFVLGPATNELWRDYDLADHTPTIENSNGLKHNGLGSSVLGGPVKALTWLVNELSSLGITLFSGQIITTGTCSIPIPILPKDQILADFGVFGSVNFSFL